jgi:hypothetical protein
VLVYLSQGVTQDRAAALAGIHRGTLRRWLLASPSVRRRVKAARREGEQVTLARAAQAAAKL